MGISQAMTLLGVDTRTIESPQLRSKVEGLQKALLRRYQLPSGVQAIPGLGAAAHGLRPNYEVERLLRGFRGTPSTPIIMASSSQGGEADSILKKTEQYLKQKGSGLPADAHGLTSRERGIMALKRLGAGNPAAPATPGFFLKKQTGSAPASAPVPSLGRAGSPLEGVPPPLAAQQAVKSEAELTSFVDRLLRPDGKPDWEKIELDLPAKVRKGAGFDKNMELFAGRYGEVEGVGFASRKDLKKAGEIKPSFVDPPEIKDQNFHGYNDLDESESLEPLEGRVSGRHKAPISGPPPKGGFVAGKGTFEDARMEFDTWDDQGHKSRMRELLREHVQKTIDSQPYSDHGDRVRGALKQLDREFVYSEKGTPGKWDFGERQIMLREFMSDPSMHNINGAELKLIAPNIYQNLRASVNQNLQNVGLPKDWNSQSHRWELVQGGGPKTSPEQLAKAYAMNAKLAFDKGNMAAANAYGKAYYAVTTGDLDYAKQEALTAREYINPRTVLVKGSPMGKTTNTQKGIATRKIRPPIERAGFPTDELADGPNLTPQDNTEYDMPWRGERPPYVRKGKARLGRLIPQAKEFAGEMRTIRGLGGQPAIPAWKNVDLRQHLQGRELSQRIKAEQKLQVAEGVTWDKARRSTPFWEHIKDPEARKVARRLQKMTAKNPLHGKWMQAFETASRKGDTQASLYLKALRNLKKGEGAAVLEEVGPQGLKYLTKLIKLLK